MACQLSIEELCTSDRTKRETRIEIPDIPGNHVHIDQAVIKYADSYIAIVLGFRAILHNANALKERACGRKDKQDQQVQILDQPRLADAGAEPLARRRDQTQRPVLRGRSGLSNGAFLVQ